MPNVEVRVWQSVGDATDLYVSARAAGGSWRALGIMPLDVSGLSESGRYRYGDLSLDVPRPGSDDTSNVQVRVWQSVSDEESLYVSARWAGGSWNDLGTRAIDLNNMSSSGGHRYGDITVISPTYLPTIVFHGIIPKGKQIETRQKILSTITFYLNLYGVAAPGITFHIGENASVLRRLIDETAGEPTAISCGSYFLGGVIFILISCENRAIEHEYFHAIQDHSIDHNDWGPEWLTEGFAEHASLLYRDSIGQESYEDAIAYNIKLLGLYRFVRLQHLVDARLWFSEGWAMATVAADWLARRANGDPFSYYRMMSRGLPWAKAFQRVFGTNVDDMYQEFQEYVDDSVPVFRYVRGVVVGHDDNPISAWRLDIHTIQLNKDWEKSNVVYGDVVYDDGSFELRIPDGTYKLRIWARCREENVFIGLFSDEIGLTQDYDLESPIYVDADIERISIKIPKPLSAFSRHCIIGDYHALSGMVYHSDGSPFPNIRITALDADNFVRDVSITGQDGIFSLQVPDHSYYLEIRAECENGDSAGLGFYHPNGGFTPVRTVGQEPRILVDGRDVSEVTIRIPAEYANDCQRSR